MRGPRVLSSLMALSATFLALLAIFSIASAGFSPGGGMHGLYLVLVLIALFLLLAALAAQGARHPGSPGEPVHATPVPPDVPVGDLLADATQRRVGTAVVVEGRLVEPPQVAARSLEQRFRGTGWTPLLTEGDGGSAAIVAVPVDLEASTARPQRAWVNALLLFATFLTTTWAGALHQGVNLLQEPGRFATGLPYSLALLAILGAHELGHYFTARRHGINVTLPYFIPVPFALGTFGAFIRILSPARHRRALFDMAVAGPYAGLVLAVPALMIGLRLSQVVAVKPEELQNATGLVGMSLESSLLLTLLASVSIGDHLGAGNAIVLHPLAFAGWLGLLVTALNLLPIGQLDGGHVADAMFGQRASSLLSGAAVVTLILLGLFVWSGLLFWAFIAYFVAGRKGLPPLNDLERLDHGRLALGWLAFAILAAILLPVPRGLFETLCARCPYL
jgi:membrane-associated protease RseP (regulator of RpoE activity)